MPAAGDDPGAGGGEPDVVPAAPAACNGGQQAQLSHEVATCHTQHEGPGDVTTMPLRRRDVRLCRGHLARCQGGGGTACPGDCGAGEVLPGAAGDGDCADPGLAGGWLALPGG